MKYLIDVLQAINGVAIYYAIVYIAVYCFRGIGIFNLEKGNKYIMKSLKELDYIFGFAMAIIIFLPSKEILTEWLIK